MVFLFAFQSLVSTIRLRKEFYFDKFLSDTFIDNTFDSNHNRFENIRRISDIWEWTAAVYVPGLFSNADFGEWWPDGDGPFSLQGATPLSTADVVDDTNSFSFEDGILLKQVRAESIAFADRACFAGHTCYDDNDNPIFTEGGDRGAYGYGEARGHFVWWSTEELGANPAGQFSAAPVSLRSWTGDGYIAAFVPFFSDTYLPPQNGTAAEVADHRLTIATRHNGRTPTYYCARYTTNGHHVVQRCNPNPAANDGVVRGMFVEMLDFLKKGHWIDARSRMVTITMQTHNHNGGIRFQTAYMFEITSQRSVLPSYHNWVMVDDGESLEDMELWKLMALVCTCWFLLLEVIELVQSGVGDYFTNVWNILDWTNFAMVSALPCRLLLRLHRLLHHLPSPSPPSPQFALVYWNLSLMVQQLAANEAFESCTSKLCLEFGFLDRWEVMETAASAKLWMSLCVCIQLLKIIKFTNVIVPKMSLMTRVLAKGCYDLLFFGIIFMIAMFAFCMLFHVQLGSYMDDFYSQPF